MSVGFARPDVADLMFRLYARSVHPELFRVHAVGEIWQERFGAVVRICDAGHVVDFRYRDGSIAEVTATRGQPLPKRKRLVERKLQGNRTDTYDFAGGLRYHVSYQVELLDVEVFGNFHEELLLDCRRAHVHHRFAGSNRLAPGALSLIRTEVTADSLLLHAYHTFPESSAVVKTQSLFEL